MAANETHILRNAALRYGLYTTVLAAGIGLSSFLVQQVGGYEIMRENGPVEWTQFVWLILSSAFFYLAARAGKRYRELFHVLLIMPMIAATRELDNLLDVQIHPGTWEAVVLVLCIYMVFQTIRHSEAVKAQAMQYSRSQAFVYLLVGFFIACVFARIMGQQSLWRTLLRENHHRAVGGFIEEILELFGYMTICVGAFESWLLSRD